MWASLGYYRRARFLLEGAKMIFAGEGFTTTVARLRKVPEIGEYTATWCYGLHSIQRGATTFCNLSLLNRMLGPKTRISILSVVPAVDANVIRVLVRLKAISANPKDSATIKDFW
ncbi:hypothetical protein CRG98_033793 [Punica granatum]|uniref:HhH-GPD domain-containing protein n=1 Tax=Punica granatum TaxID=22663 RepID=A0A2I0IQT1_PUNGR|nr:hypothetical protein CRG98_033793 [Punica granatum]